MSSEAAAGAGAGAGAGARATTPDSRDSAAKTPREGESGKALTCEAKLWFTGTGTSSGVPLVSCLVKKPVTCQTCSRAKFEFGSRDRRGNTGCIVQVPREGAVDGVATFAIDCGKRFWESALDMFVAQPSLRNLDAIVLTHDHLDATAGLDDMRDFCRAKGGSIDVYCSPDTLKRVSSMFPFLVDTSKATGSGEVASLRFHTFTPGKPFDVCGITLTPFTVLHGPNYACNAFRIGSLVWMSDVSEIPDESREYLRGAETVILDALWPRPEVHKSHFGLEQAIDEVAHGFDVDTRPLRTWLVGMNHEMPHDDTNRMLRKRGYHDIQLAYDGQMLRFTATVATPTADSSPAPAIESDA